jgi:hypothetical protein
MLAVDLGLRTGLASYSADGLLTGYTAVQFPSYEELSRTVSSALINDLPSLTRVIVEGDTVLTGIWERCVRECPRGVDISFLSIDAEEWREVRHRHENNNSIFHDKSSRQTCRSVLYATHLIRIDRTC